MLNINFENIVTVNKITTPNNLSIVKSFGLNPEIGFEEIRKLLNDGLLEKDSFSSFVDLNYKKIFYWGNFEASDFLKKSLFARMLVNISYHFYKTKEGKYECNHKFYNGSMFVPKKINKDNILVYKSNFYTRFGFMRKVKGKITNEDELLVNFKETLVKFDQLQDILWYRLISRKSNDINTVNNYLLKNS